MIDKSGQITSEDRARGTEVPQKDQPQQYNSDVPGRDGKKKFDQEDPNMDRDDSGPLMSSEDEE
jgi:hypothetical protein